MKKLITLLFLNILVQTVNAQKPKTSVTKETNKVDTLNTIFDQVRDVSTTKNTDKSTSKISKPYQVQLDNLNNYLKTLNNGYYGQLEVKDGYVYRTTTVGNYDRFKMEDVGEAYVNAKYKSVKLKCNNNPTCIETNWTPTKTNDYIGFTANYRFDYQELATLLNNFRDAYLGKSVAQPVSKPNNTASYQLYLTKLNNYLKIFDGGYFGNFEVKDGYVILKMKSGNYCKFKMEDMENGKILSVLSDNDLLKFQCKNNKECMETNWTSSKKDSYIGFSQEDNPIDYQPLALLLNNFRESYLGLPLSTTAITTKPAVSTPGSIVGTLLLFYTGRDRPAVVHGFTIYSKSKLYNSDIEKIVDELRKKHGDKLTTVGFSHYTFVPDVKCSKAMSLAGRTNNRDNTYSDNDNNSIYCLDPYIVKD